LAVPCFALRNSISRTAAGKGGPYFAAVRQVSGDRFTIRTGNKVTIVLSESPGAVYSAKRDETTKRAEFNGYVTKVHICDSEFAFPVSFCAPVLVDSVISNSGNVNIDGPPYAV
jgi:hypothetical protein